MQCLKKSLLFNNQSPQRSTTTCCHKVFSIVSQHYHGPACHIKSNPVTLLADHGHGNVERYYSCHLTHSKNINKHTVQLETFSTVQQWVNIYLFPIRWLATDNKAIAETVSASSVSRWRASLNEQPRVEAERCRERQYLPTHDQDRVTVRG